MAAATKEIIEGGAAAGDGDGKRSHPTNLPTTLAEALAKHKNLDSAMSDLWKLLYFLRAGDSGADLEVLPNALGSRSCAVKKEMKWHNKLMSHISQMDAELKQPALRQSRQAAWMSHTETARKQLAPTLPAALEIDRSDIICIKVKNKWEVSLVLSVFRNYAARSGGAQLTSLPLPRGSLHSVRVVRAMHLLSLIGSFRIFMDLLGMFHDFQRFKGKFKDQLPVCFDGLAPLSKVQCRTKPTLLFTDAIGNVFVRWFPMSMLG